MAKILLIFTCASLLLLAACHFNCIHDTIEHMQVPELLSEDRNLEETEKDWQPIRIHFDYSNLLKLEDPVLEKKIKYEIFPAVKQWFEKTVKVVKRPRTRLYKDDDAGLLKTPQDHTRKGVPDADLVIYVGFKEKDSYRNTLAYGTYCEFDRKYDNRPTFGEITIYLDKLDNKISRFENQVDAIIHEMVHLMGFSNNLLTRKGMKKVQRNGKETKVITSKKVVEVAKKHFKCDNITGIPLEPGWGASHWEKEVLKDDLMSNFAGAGMISEFTLAALEDSTWYQVNYSMAEPLLWGLNKGCEFLEAGCKPEKFPEEFCSVENQEGCSNDEFSKSKCQKQKGDRCSFYVETNECASNNVLKNSTTGEATGPTSKCVLSKKDSTQEGKCFPYSCDDSHTTVTFTVGDSKVKCSQSDVGKLISNIVCPDPKKYCKSFYSECPNYCSGKGTCLNGKCECIPGFEGDDCSSATDDCPANCFNRGKCEKGKCVCDQGYLGIIALYYNYLGFDCSKVDCSGKHNCFNRGVCVSPNVCKCEPSKYYWGHSCERVVCGCDGWCSWHGKCNRRSRNCECHKGWVGYECQHKVVCKNNCNNNGECEGLFNKTTLEAKSICKCKPEWEGEDCSIAKTVDVGVNSTGAGNNNTVVNNTKPTNNTKPVKNNTKPTNNTKPVNNNTKPTNNTKPNTQPNNNQTTKNETKPTFNCEKNCSNNGKCVTENKCECNNGFTGKLCEKKDCLAENYTFDEKTRRSRCNNDCECNSTRYCTRFGRCNNQKTSSNGELCVSETYVFDEKPKRHKCSNDCECNAMRYCSKYGWCHNRR